VEGNEYTDHVALFSTESLRSPQQARLIRRGSIHRIGGLCGTARRVLRELNLLSVGPPNDAFNPDINLLAYARVIVREVHSARATFEVRDEQQPVNALCQLTERTEGAHCRHAGAELRTDRMTGGKCLEYVLLLVLHGP
jgi:hypothetical protein